MDLSSDELKLRAIRGATTVEVDSREAIEAAIIELMDQLIERNHITLNELVTINVTVTNDLHSWSPARVVRTHYDWSDVPFFSALEPDIMGMPHQCIRFLILAYSPLKRFEIQHIYLHRAQALRPDLSETGKAN